MGEHVAALERAKTARRVPAVRLADRAVLQPFIARPATALPPPKPKRAKRSP